MTHRGHIIVKITVMLLSAVLIVCCIAPIQRARRNTQEEYRDLYRFTNRAQEYYRVLNSAIYNLNEISVRAKAQGAFNAFSASSDLLYYESLLNHKLRSAKATLELIPDPGSREMMRTTDKSFESYEKYRDLVLSSRYSDIEFEEELYNSYSRVKKNASELYAIIYE